MTTAATCQPVSDAASAACPTDRGRRVPVGLLWLLATVAVGAVMLGLSAGANVAPVIEADNAYIFMAADRLFTGEGATAIPRGRPCSRGPGGPIGFFSPSGRWAIPR
jgi:hypothetical protein